MSAPNPEKGKRYLAQLDQALCNGNWADVPELARKTDKHAPDRRCFTLTARTEAQIASASRRPTSASSNDTSSIHSLGEAIPKLQEAIKAGSSDAEEAYCAGACLAEIYWLREDPRATLEALPQSDAAPGRSTSNTVPLGWLEVCSVKTSFLKAAAWEVLGEEQKEREVYRASASQAPGSRTQELRRWTERLLARGGIYASKARAQPTLAKVNESLAIFRAWASFWQRAAPSAAGSGASPLRVDTPRRQVWRGYYDLLSSILQHGLLYNPSATPNSQPLVVFWTDSTDQRYVDAKVRQRAELKRVEATYESLLLNETRFPKASETNAEVEEWVEQAVGNWKILCGGEWTDGELGEGGKEAVSRSTLDILYRAATKTFHSTAILRQLFTIHAAIGDFDLAMHAFGSYVDIVGKGKARTAKTGEHEVGLDTDDVAVQTAAEAMQILCKYGDREQAEKALAVSHTLAQWLGEQRPTAEQELETTEDNQVDTPDSPPQPAQPQLTRKSSAIANRAIGIARAHWARVTYEDDKRNDYYQEALRHLKKAFAIDNRSVATAYALARVLAETQHVSSAMDVIRQSIAVSHVADDAYTDTHSLATVDENGPQNEEDGDDDEDDDWERQRQLMPLWHLLSLCLTAKDDFDPANSACEAAFDQFGDPSVLWGRSGSRSGSLSQARTSRGLIDQMDDFERGAVLEIKMTQLATLEMTEGIDKAVESINELLVYYTRLFGNPDQLRTSLKAPPTPVVTPPLKSSGGTLRSIAGSIRPRSGQHGGETASRTAPQSSPGSQGTNGPANSQPNGSSIAITVTNEDRALAEEKHSHHHHHLHLPFRSRGQHGDHKEAASLRSKKSVEDVKEKEALNNDEEPPPAPPADADIANPDHAAANPPAVQPALSTSMSPEVPVSPQQPLKMVEHNVPHNALPRPTGHDDQPLEQDMRLPAPHPASNAMPASRFGSMQERQYKICVLVKVWLFIAALYTRASSHDDASGAIEEAFSLVEVFEADKGAEHATARKLYEKGWGGGKSVDALWADVYASRGDLAIAQHLPFAAMAHYEDALTHFPDHPSAIIALSNLLMDISEQTLPAEEPQPLLKAPTASSGSLFTNPTLLNPIQASRPTTATAKSTLATPGRTLPPSAARAKDPSPAELNRLAARDRAYMLLANLTKLGTGWDHSEAWYTLARAHELSKDLTKAKQALWWVVELEDAKPVRGWAEVVEGGYVL